MKWLQQGTDECPYSSYKSKEVKYGIISNSKTRILCDLNRSYHTHLGSWRWHGSLHSRAPESWEGVTYHSSVPRKRCAIPGHHQGFHLADLGACKQERWSTCLEGEASILLGRAKGLGLFLQTVRGDKHLEKREAACYWQTELGELGLNLASVLWYLCGLGQVP